MYLIRTCILFFLVVFLLPLGAQDFPYQLDWKREVTIFGAAGSLSGWAHLRESRLEGLTAEQLSVLNPATVNGFDRGATRQHSDAFRRLSDDLLRGSVLAPGLLLLGKPARSKPPKRCNKAQKRRAKLRAILQKKQATP